jgi:hypothetical protein
MHCIDGLPVLILVRRFHESGVHSSLFQHPTFVVTRSSDMQDIFWGEKNLCTLRSKVDAYESRGTRPEENEIYLTTGLLVREQWTKVKSVRVSQEILG